MKKQYKMHLHFQRFLALVRRNPRQAAVVTVAIAAVFLILLNPPAPRVSQTAPPRAQAPGGAQNVAPVSAPEAVLVDLMLFPESAGLRTSNLTVSRVEANLFEPAHWVLHVADPSRPATIVWSHILTQPAQNLKVDFGIRLYVPRTTLAAEVLFPLAGYAPKIEIIADGQVVRPLAPALWGDKHSVLLPLQLPHPATRIEAKIFLPPRLQSGYPAVTHLKLEGW